MQRRISLFGEKENQNTSFNNFQTILNFDEPPPPGVFNAFLVRLGVKGEVGGEGAMLLRDRQGSGCRHSDHVQPDQDTFS